MTNSDKRQRHKDGHRNRVEEARLAEAKARRRRTILGLGIAAVLVIGVAIAASVTSSDDKTEVNAGGSTSTTGLTDPALTTASTPSTPTVSVPSPPAGATITGATPCPATDGSSERTTAFAEAPPTCIDKAKTYTAEVMTSEGAITVALDTKQSPIAVNNFVVLSRYHFYDENPFHRIVPGFVDQTGSMGPDLGSGGPGYDLPEEKPTRTYAKGDVAMAASSAGPSGSQFFFTVDATALNASPNYPILGTVTVGQDIVEKINQFGDQASDGAPTKVITMKTVTIKES